MYTIVIRKDCFNGVNKPWTADLLYEGQMLFKSWFYGFKTKKNLLENIMAVPMMDQIDFTLERGE